jgi:hypothetical protein
MDSPISQVAKTRNFAVIVFSGGSLVGSLADAVACFLKREFSRKLSYSIE